MQRLAAVPEGDELLELLDGGELGGGVTVANEGELVDRHPGTVVPHSHAEAGHVEHCVDLRRLCVQGIQHQLLESVRHRRAGLGRAELRRVGSIEDADPSRVHGGGAAVGRGGHARPAALTRGHCQPSFALERVRRPPGRVSETHPNTTG
eukprot:scaffold132387_cov69-Phaeocystis_antarctica.AAC.5